jgi:selenocysteine-specific elongation factor
LLKTAPAQLKQNSRVRLHIGTNEVMARVRLLDADTLKPGASAFAQIQCETPVTAENQDRFVIRRYSPMVTIGGGLILQANPPRHKRFETETLSKLKVLETGDIFDVIEQASLKGPAGIKSAEDLSKLTRVPLGEIQEKLTELVARQKLREIPRKNKIFYLHISLHLRLQREILAQLEQFHREHPLKQGMTPGEILSNLDNKTELFLVQALLKELEASSKIISVQDKMRLADYQITLTPEQSQLKSEVEQYFIQQEFSPPDTAEIIAQFRPRFQDVEKIIAYLLEQKILVYIEDGLLLHQKFVAKAQALILAHFRQQAELKMGDFRDLIQASRKYALPLLNYFDQHGLTIRQDDVRILNE